MPHVITQIQRPSKETIVKFSGISTATIHEAQGKKGAMRAEIKPIYSGMKVCGPAITVQGHPGDNLIIHKAMVIAQSGDVLVVNVEGHTEAGHWGEVMAVQAMAQGINGLVIDGAVRDGEAIRGQGFPVFALGLSMKGTYKELLGLVNHPIVCGGIMVNPGDLIIGDDDGICVVPLEQVEEVLKKSIARDKREAEMMKLLAVGKTSLELLGFGKVLEQKGLEEV